MTTTPTISAQDESSAAGGSAPVTKGSLLRSELHRFSARRFIRWLLLLSAVAYVIIITLVAVTQFSKPDAGVQEGAERRVAALVEEQKGYWEQCVNDPARPENIPVEECGDEPTAADFPLEQFIDQPPFDLARKLPHGAIAVSVALAILAFLIGATYVGAEWSSRSMVALLFWEPRRLKVIGVKLAVTAAAAAALAVLSQALWWATAEIIARTRGNRDNLPDDFWPDLFGQQARGVLFVVLIGLLGFGVANLIRNTGASFGVGFVYFVIVENAVREFRPGWQEWLLGNNAAALLQTGGYKIYVYDQYVDEQGSFVDGDREVLLSNLHGGLVIGIATLAIVVLGAVLFKRRDLH